MTVKPRGQCPACSHVWPLRKDRTVQAHHAYPGQPGFPRLNCPGGGELPAAPMAEEKPLLWHLATGTPCPGRDCEECQLASSLTGNIYLTVLSDPREWPD